MAARANRVDKLTPAVVRRLEPEIKRYAVHDSDLKGFLIQVDTTGSKVFRIRRSHNGVVHQARVADAKIVTVDEARQKAREMLRDIDLGSAKNSEAHAPTFAEVTAKAKLSAAYRDLSPNSQAYYNGYLSRLVLPSLGKCRITAITRAVLKELFEVTYREKGASAAHGVRSAVGKVFEYAVDAGVISESPARGMKRLGKLEPRERFLAPAELRSLWLVTARNRVAQDTRDALRLCVYTVLRRAEIAEATWSEVDFDNKIWTIPKARTKRKRASYFVPLSDPALRILQERFDACVETPSGNDRIFSLRPDSLTQSMKKLTSKQPFERVFSPHDLRRTFATVMAGNGVSEELLERVLNHAPEKRGAIRSYNHHKYISQKRTVLVAWAELVAEVVEGRMACYPGEDSH